MIFFLLSPAMEWEKLQNQRDGMYPKMTLKKHKDWGQNVC